MQKSSNPHDWLHASKINAQPVEHARRATMVRRLRDALEDAAEGDGCAIAGLYWDVSNNQYGRKTTLDLGDSMNMFKRTPPFKYINNNQPSTLPANQPTAQRNNKTTTQDITTTRKQHNVVKFTKLTF